MIARRRESTRSLAVAPGSRGAKPGEEPGVSVAAVRGLWGRRGSRRLGRLNHS